MSHNGHTDKDSGSASYRLTDDDGWTLVGEKRHNRGSQYNRGYGTKFYGYDTDRYRHTPTNYYREKTQWVDKDYYNSGKRFEIKNTQYNEVRSDTYQKYPWTTETQKTPLVSTKTECVDDSPKPDNNYVCEDDSESDDSESVRKQKIDNYKKILCKNINNLGKCIYNNKCLYAHSLEEQNVEPIRAIAYDMIKKKDDLSHIDLSKNKHLYNNLHSLSRLCQHCDEGTCTGGYNCKHGVCDKIYAICLTDLNKGTCKGACGKIHLTSKGLVPYGDSIVKNLKTKITIPKAMVVNEEFFKKLNHNMTYSESTQESQSREDSEVVIDQDRDIGDNSENIVLHDENQWDRFVLTQDTQSARKNKRLDDNDNDSLCSDDSEKIEYVLNFFPVKTEGIYADTYDDIPKREKKLTKSIFRIDMMCI